MTVRVPGITPRRLAAVVVLAVAVAGSAAAQPARISAAAAVREMSFAAGAPVSAAISRQGTVSFLRTAPGTSIPVDPAASAEEQARAFLGRYGAAFGLAPGIEVETQRVDEDGLGMEHVRLRQTWRGIPVAGGEIGVHLEDDGVVAVHAKTAASLREVPTMPRVTPGAALAVVRAELEAALGAGDAELSVPRLEILDRRLLGGPGFQPLLAWFVEARRIDLREYVWVDAVAGRVVLRFSQLAHARNRLIHDANDPGDGVYDQLPGTLIRSEAGPPVAGAAAADANAAYDHAGDTYDYFLAAHGRDSYDDAGATLVSTVRFCPSSQQCPYVNAFWNGVQMVYGAGFPAADDVAAHELTHAVVEHTANLFYYMQSGALNESYADIFGETVDLTNDSGTDTPAVRWKLAEDIPGIGAIRDMEEPGLFDDPAKTSDPDFFCGDAYFLDRGGVHHNSGVPNKAFSLMVDGGSFNGRTIAGIGLAKAAAVQYRALSRYLLSASDFLDNDQALRRSCDDLVGTLGITAADCAEVGEALDAVEMAATWPCDPIQAEVPALCPAGQGPELWYYEDFEGPIAGVADCPSGFAPAAWCINHPDSFLGAFATSGERSLWIVDVFFANTFWFWRDLPSMPPPGARMQFNHSYGFDNEGGTFFDAGQVATSTDGGTSFQNAQFLITDGAGYDGPISTCCGNPFGGLAGFVGDSFGYTASQLDLSSLSGTAFSYAFILATDNAVDDFGWFVDDVRIYTCPACPAQRMLDAAYTGIAEYYNATDSITAGDGFRVEPGETVTLEAGDRVVFTDGFSVDGGLRVITGSDGCP